MSSLKQLFLLDPNVVFLNHGSYGATPIPVFEAYQAWQRRLERQPVLFLGRQFNELVWEARTALGEYQHADPDDLVYIPNASGSCFTRNDGMGAITHVITADGGHPRRLTSVPSEDAEASWSRDGKWIYFHSNRTGRSEIWRVPSSGGQAEQVTDKGGWVAFESVDGKTLFYTKGQPSPLFAKPLAGGPERQVLEYVGPSRDFAVLEDGIYYGGQFEKGKTPILFYEFSTGRSRLLAMAEGLTS